MIKKELAPVSKLELTQDSFKTEGIEVRVNQFDIIDALVEQEIMKIEGRVDFLNNRYKELKENLNKEKEKFLEKAMMKIPDYKGTTITAREINIGGAVERIEFLDVDTFKFKDSKKYEIRSRGIAVKGEALIRISYAISIGDLEMTGCKSFKSGKFKCSKKLVDQILEHNKQVIEFIDSIPAKGINEKEIAKSLKNKFTIEILKTSSPDFKNKLKNGFGLTL